MPSADGTTALDIDEISGFSNSHAKRVSPAESWAWNGARLEGRGRGRLAGPAGVLRQRHGVRLPVLGRAGAGVNRKVRRAVKK